MREVASGECDPGHDPDCAGRSSLQQNLPNRSEIRFDREPADIQSVAPASPVIPDCSDKSVFQSGRIPLVAEIDLEADRDFLPLYPIQIHSLRTEPRN